MVKKNDDFFIEKKDWSIVKDELFGCYFKPYVSKILHTGKPLIYVDCFAGKGKFEDGKPGSPLIALDIIDQCCASTTMEHTIIEVVFIELHHTDSLKENLKGYPWVNIVSGKYEDNIQRILEGKKQHNVFLYIDPYGIKSLQCSIFDDLARHGFNSIELLINLNSFGFIREACHAFGATFDDKTLFEDLVEYESTTMDTTNQSIMDLNEIAGGDYWQTIIMAYKEGKIDGYEAEKLFAEQYCKRLMSNYTYVLNMPLRIKRGQRPKYRLIHATNHRDGCLLMVDNICYRWEVLQGMQSGGQVSFWKETLDNQFIDEDDIKEKCIDYYSHFKEWVSLHDSLAAFFMRNGPICATGNIKSVLKKLEREGMLEVCRTPDTSPQGRPTRFMSEGRGQTVSVRWAK